MKKTKKWIGGAVKHPGKLTRDAKRAGRSKLEEAKVLSHSKDHHKRGEGLLGLRFLGKAKHGNIKHSRKRKAVKK